MMDEKKVREAIYCMKASIGETMCEECVNYYKCDHTKMDDMMRTAIEALEKQLPKKPTYEGDGYAPDGTFVYDTWECPNCGECYEVDYDDYDYCPKCGQKIDWSE